ncbi:hypothetical protein IMCC14465_10420 [alpha proteobacterium IMCC14465]|uniref:Uncharacterized protein n=1 Tax=alpha proteobacterium IMCC14465 TaxID=1220535 RepID=J9DH86_9PROT|nr:hypothetical protein IMCC14465_10420 [alpha proteobacterium IMCC14465]
MFQTCLFFIHSLLNSGGFSPEYFPTDNAPEDEYRCRVLILLQRAKTR